MKIQKIVIFFPLFFKGGMEKVITTILDSFENYHLEILFITYKKNVHLKTHNKNVRIITPNLKKNYVELSNFKKIFLCLKELIKILKIEDKNRTIIFSVQNSVLSIPVAKYFNYKIVVSNATPIKAFFYMKNFFKQLIFLTFKLILYNFADKIIVNSESNRKSLSTFILKKKKMIKIYNPISFSNKIKIKKKKFQLLTVSRLTHDKGIHILIKSIKKLNNNKIRLLILGDGDFKKKLKSLTYKLGIKKNVVFKGWVKNTEKYYKQSSIFILPTLYEGFGNVLVEAMNYNLICLSTKNSGGPDEILENGKNGFLFKKNDVHQLKDKIQFCLTNKKLVNLKLKNAKNSLKRFNKKKIIYQYYKTLCLFNK